MTVKRNSFHSTVLTILVEDAMYLRNLEDPHQHKIMCPLSLISTESEILPIRDMPMLEHI
jgi:hypothetical protein